MVNKGQYVYKYMTYRKYLRKLNSTVALAMGQLLFLFTKRLRV